MSKKLKKVAVTVPLAELDKNQRLPLHLNIDVNGLKTYHRETLLRLHLAHRQSNAELRTGRPVASIADTIRKLLEDVDAASKTEAAA